MYVAGILIQPSKNSDDPVILHRYDNGNVIPVETKIYSPERISEAIEYAEILAQQNNWIRLNKYNWQEAK
ncbi:hypothetical protein [Allocoleopsis sp.]|uniref:hypothetical protein n=1 Tax=Allocoleopsis sp. TaxID=3088169 RepID=UPI002FD6A67A